MDNFGLIGFVPEQFVQEFLGSKSLLAGTFAGPSGAGDHQEDSS